VQCSGQVSRSRLVQTSRDSSWLVAVTKTGSVGTKIDAGTGIVRPPVSGERLPPIVAADGALILQPGLVAARGAPVCHSAITDCSEGQ